MASDLRHKVTDPTLGSARLNEREVGEPRRGVNDQFNSVWNKVNDAKAVLQKIDRRFEESNVPMDELPFGETLLIRNPRTGVLTSSLRSTGGHKRSNEGERLIRSSRVGFREPVVSYLEEHDPTKYGYRDDRTGSTIRDDSDLARSFRDLRKVDYDVLRVSYRGEPQWGDPQDLTLTPKEKPAETRNLNSDVTFEPRPTPTKGRDLRSVGVAETVVNKSYSSLVGRSPPHTRYDVTKQKKKLEGNSEALARLKEKIRRQKENRSPSSMSDFSVRRHEDVPIVTSSTMAEPERPRVRKIAVGPPAPKYKGFSAAQTRLKTPDGKLWREEGNHFKQVTTGKVATKLFKDTKKTAPSGGQKAATTRKKAGKNQKQKTVRKVGKIQSDDAGHKRSIITPSSWRENPQLGRNGGVKKKPLKPPPPPISAEMYLPQTSVEKDIYLFEDVAKELPQTTAKELPQTDAKELPQTAENEKVEDIEVGNTEKSKDGFGNTAVEDKLENANISAAVKGILTDLHLDTSSSDSEGSEVAPKVTTKVTTPSKVTTPKKRHKTNLDRFKPPPEPVIEKVRHYDQSQVQKYMLKQKADRRKKQEQQKVVAQQASQRRTQQLDELDKRQKDQRVKTLSHSKKQHETFTKTPPTGDKELGAEERIAKFMSKLERYNDLERLIEPTHGGDRVSEFMQKLDKYLNEDDSAKTQSAKNDESSRDESAGNNADSLRDDDAKNERDLTIDELRTSSRVADNFDSFRVSPRFKMEEKSSRIAALKANSEALQERIAMESRRLLEQPLFHHNDLLLRSSEHRYSPTRNDLSPRSNTKVTRSPGFNDLKFSNMTSPDRNDSRFSGVARSPRVSEPIFLGSEVNDLSLPGVANLEELVESSEQRRREEESAAKIQAAYRGHRVRNALETWELPSGRTLNDLRPRDDPESELSDLEPRSVTEILEELKTRGFCGEDKVDGGRWRPQGDEGGYLGLSERLKSSQPSHRRDNYLSNHPGNHDLHSNQQDLSKPPWQRSNGDKYSVVNVFTRNYLETLKHRPLEKENSSPRQPDLNRPITPLDPIEQPIELPEYKLDLPTLESHDYNLDSFNSSSSTSSSKVTSSKSKDVTPRSASLDFKVVTSDLKVTTPDLEPATSDPKVATPNPKVTTYDPKGLITWSDTLGPRKKLIEDKEESLVEDEPLFPPSAPLPTTGLRFSPAVLEHQMALELNRFETIGDTIKQLCGSEATQSVALAQQETVSLAQILQSRQLQHEVEMERLTLKAKESALEVKGHELEVKGHELEVKGHELKNKEQVKEMRYRDYSTDSSRTITSQSTRSASPQNTYSSNTFESYTDGYKPSSSKPHVSHNSHSQPSGVPQLGHHPSSGHRPPHRGYKPPSTDVSEHSTTSARNSESSIPEQIVKKEEESDRSITEDIEQHATSDDLSVTFDESMTEGEIAEISRRAIVLSESHRRHQRHKTSLSSAPNLPHPLLNQSDGSSDEAAPRTKGRLPVVDEMGLFGEGSFSEFMSASVQHYMIEQELRSRHHAAMLKLREKAIKEKTQVELAWLEQQKRQLRNKGDDDKMPPIKKKKRALLLRLQVETDEIKKLQAANWAASQDRGLILQQQEDIHRMVQSTQQMKEKLKISTGEEGKTDDVAMTSSTPLPREIPSDENDTSEIQSDVDLNNSVQTSRLMKQLKRYTSCLDDRRLTIREKTLLRRRKEVVRLLEWKRMLDADEKKVEDMEKKVMSVWGDDPKTEDKPPTEEKKGDLGSTSESSIAEEIVTHDRSVTHGRTGDETSSIRDKKSQDVSSETTVEDYSQTFDSEATKTNNDPSVANNKSTSVAKNKLEVDAKKDPSKKTSSASSSPSQTTPLLSKVGGAKQKGGGAESWSDESFSQTQSETEQSDVECRVHALQEELRRRSLVAERLKKQQKKKKRENLRAQEASLKNQIEAYNVFIRKTQQELSSELENVPAATHHTVAKPQIRSPRKSDQPRPFRASISPDQSPRAGSKVTSLMRKHRSDSESSGRSSRSLSFDDEHQQHSPEDTSPPNGSKAFLTPLKTPPDRPNKLDIKPLPNLGNSLKVGAQKVKVEPTKKDATQKKEYSPTTPPSSYSDDFSSVTTEDEVSERLSDHDQSSEKSELSVALLDLQDHTKIEDKAHDDDDLTPVASPCHTPTPSAPDTPTSPRTPVQPQLTPTIIGEPQASRVEDKVDNQQITNKLSDQLLRSLLKDSMDATLSAHESSTSRVRQQEEPRRRKQKDDENIPPLGDSKRSKLSNRNEPKLSATAKGILQLLTSPLEGDKEPVVDEKPAERENLSEDFTNDLLNETINQVLEIRKQKVLKLNEEKREKVDIADEVESILHDNRDRNVIKPQQSEDREPVVARPVSPIFGGSSQEDEEWFDDDFGLSSFKKQTDPPAGGATEAWNKEEADSTRFEPPTLKFVVPHRPADILHLVHSAVAHCYEAYINGFLDNVEVPETFLQSTVVASDQPAVVVSDQPDPQNSDETFKRSLFELVVDLTREVYGEEFSAGQVWSKVKRRRRPSFSRSIPNNQQELEEIIGGEVGKLFGFPEARRETRATMKWGSLKKKDRVDLILIEELREEEPDWTDYDADERTVKMQLTETIFDLLLNDSIACLNSIHNEEASQL